MQDANVSYATRRSVLVIADPSYEADELVNVVDLTGARLAGRVTLADADIRLSSGSRADVVAINLQGAEADAASELLCRVDAMVRENAFKAVIAFDQHQIDDVTSRILGSHVQLLCAPTLAQGIAAMSIATKPDGNRAHDGTRDERARLQMLNDEVARIAETLARLTRTEERRSPGLGEPYLGHDGAGDLQPVKGTTVRNALRARRMRNTFFRNELFADPAWDMLLDLYAADLEHVRVSVSSLCIAASVPGTTALRWIGTMLEEDLFQRTADPVDRRRAYISLSASARNGMHRYFDAIQRAGLASA